MIGISEKPLVTMISKPVVPPWDDSAKNIVKYQVSNGKRYLYRVLTDHFKSALPPWVLTAPIYSGAGQYSAGIKQNLKVMMYGMKPKGASIYHYFFAPNPLTSKAGRFQKALAGVKTVQTMCSAPASYDKIKSMLFCDVTIALSLDTKTNLIKAGVDENKIRLIHPGIEPIVPLSKDRKIEIRRSYGFPETGPLVIFPGDYEFSSAAETTARAVPILKAAFADIKVVFACRIKREPSKAIRDKLKQELIGLGLGETAVFMDRVDDMPSFVGCADVLILPSESLYAKMDIPLVLLEAMSQKIPLVLADVPPLSELIQRKVALGVPPKSPEKLAESVLLLLRNEPLRAEMGQIGTDVMNVTYSAPAMAKAVEDVYDEVMEL